MTNRIGPSFPSELVAAGIMNVSVFPDGTLGYTPGMSDADKAKAEAVLAKHDPTKPGPAAPLSASGEDIIGSLSATDATKADVRDLVRLAARSVVLGTNAKLARIAKAVGRAPDDLLKAAQG